MKLVLIGPPAAGKTRIGKRLARHFDVPFIDTDKLIVAAHGPIPEIFAREGEAAFRAYEREKVVEALQEEAVISLGGGAILAPDTQRDLAEENVVLITVEPRAVQDRITNGKRPLVTDIDSWSALVQARMPIYRALADVTVDSTFRPVEDIIEEIAAWVKETTHDR